MAGPPSEGGPSHAKAGLSEAGVRRRSPGWANSRTMNNLDASRIHVLKQKHPTVFGPYFTPYGTLPNLNVNARHEAERIFNSLSPDESFDDFMVRYRRHMQSRKDGALGRLNAATQTTGEAGPQTTSDAEHPVAETAPSIPSRVGLPLVQKAEEKFDILKFLRQKDIHREYHCLKFQSDDETFDEVGMTLPEKNASQFASRMLREISEHVETLNKRNRYRLLDVRYEKNRCF